MAPLLATSKTSIWWWKSLPTGAGARQCERELGPALLRRDHFVGPCGATSRVQPGPACGSTRGSGRVTVAKLWKARAKAFAGRLLAVAHHALPSRGCWSP